jgi:flagellar protein FliJ
MSTFQFRMATLLRLREATRDERRAHLAEAQRADAELQSQLTQVGDELRRLQHECRKTAGPGTVDVPRLIEVDRYMAELRAQESQLQQQRQTLAEEIDRRREAVLEADRDVQSLEKLRDRQLQAHRQEEERRENKRLDEAALQAGLT